MNCLHARDEPDQVLEGWTLTLVHHTPGTPGREVASCRRWIGSGRQLDMPVIEEILVYEARSALRAITALEDRE